MIKRIFFTLVFALCCFQARGATPSVVVTIQPLYSLVFGVMKGVAKPKLLLPPNEDTHHFSLTPSEAKSIHQADLFIWVGPQMELALKNAVKTLSAKGRVLTLLDLPGMTTYELEPGHVDPHIWLDPQNAKVIVRQVADVLSGMDPDHGSEYELNATELMARLDLLTAKLVAELKPLENMQYFVYHDAFQYFEKAFGLSRSIPVVKDTEHTIRASQRAHIEKLARENNIHCIFGEPFHGEKVVTSLGEQLDLHVGFLDPIGGSHKVPPQDSYFDTIETIARNLKECALKGPKK
jgi:zinc transport system substrate-binding protein